MLKAETIFNYRRAYKNWFSVLYRMYRARNNRDQLNSMIKVIQRDTGQKLNIAFPLVWQYSLAKSLVNPIIHNIHMNNGLLAFTYDGYYLMLDLGCGGDIFESFFKEDYNFLNVERKDCVDIGANIGDTAIYFAIKGARRVISLEPYPYTFALASKNVDSLKLKNKVILLNAGYGEDKEIRIDTSFIPDNISFVRENENGAVVPIYSLRTLVDKYNIDSGILKMDCEGCEYNLLKETNETIAKFSMIQIEYHYGYEELVNKLKECKFDVNYTKPKKSYIKGEDRSMQVGYIYAKRP